MRMRDDAESFYVHVDFRLRFRCKAGLQTVMLATVRVVARLCGAGAPKLDDEVYEAKFTDVDVAIDGIERIVEGRPLWGQENLA
jgi:hypothetical protein